MQTITAVAAVAFPAAVALSASGTQLDVFNDNADAVRIRITSEADTTVDRYIPAHSHRSFAFAGNREAASIAAYTDGAADVTIDVEVSSPASPVEVTNIRDIGTAVGLVAGNNLSDIDDAATARTNLGLGTAATQASSAFLQPGNNLSDVDNAATARANLGIVGLVSVPVIANRDADLVVGSGATEALVFEVETRDTGGAYDATTGVFTVPANADYEIYAQAFRNGSEDTYLAVQVDSGGGWVEVARGTVAPSGEASASSSVRWVGSLNATNQVRVVAVNPGASGVTVYGTTTGSGNVTHCQIKQITT